ncbi:MAG: hypothetical protein K8L99_05595 [Anaerolineae bacterium]|nr:hypothetical protein [Anaerolineae bacterium]
MDAYRHIALCFSLIGAALLLISPIAAQDTGSIAPFETVEGEIGAGESQEWTFTAADGEVLSFVAESDDTLDPVMTLSNSSGTLISNDDYQYPDNPSAILEAVTMPRNDTYTLTITGFNDTEGSYTLTMYEGFANPDFVETGEWQSPSEELVIEAAEDQTALVISGIAQRGIAFTNIEAAATDLYLEVPVLEMSGRNTWVAGLAFRGSDSDRYYLYEVDERGQWRFLLHEDGQDQVIRDWLTHPAIIAGESSFRLAVLMRGSGFDFFYNSVYMGHLTDDTLDDGDQIGLVIETSNALDSETIGRFDHPRMTTPLEEAAVPQQIITSSASFTVQELQRRGLIPAEGQMRLTVSESFVTLNQPGVNKILLGGGETFADFAIGTTISWQIQGTEDPAGCGLVLRASGENDYLLAYVDQTGAYGVSSRSGDQFAPGIFGENATLAASDTHNLLLVLADDQLHYYIDGTLVGSLEDSAEAGEIGNAAINFEPAATSCQFNNTWLWAW